MRRIGIKEAEKSFGGLVRDVEIAKEVTITRFGKPVAVVMSLGRYSQLLRGAQNTDTKGDA